jgi:very-short-patch-repair endonuclease
MERRIIELAEQQHGLIARYQARAAGLTRDGWRHLDQSDDWELASSRVLRRTGAPRTREQSILADVLHAGADAVTTKATALALWALPGWSLLPTHLLVPRRSVRREGAAIIHTTTAIDQRHVATVASIPTVTPVRALFDVAGSIHPKKLERALDNAWARRLITHALLHRTLDELAERGRPGIAVMRELAETRPPDYRPPESGTEAKLNDILRDAGKATLRRQVNAGDATNWVGRFDLADRQVPLIVEVHSELFHGSNLDRQRDKAKRAAMEVAGWTFLEVWDTEVWRTPREVVRRIEAARRDLRRAA